ASPLSDIIPKDNPNAGEEIASASKTTQMWITLKGWYNTAREWLVGKNGCMTNFYYRTGDPPKKNPNHRNRNGCAKCIVTPKWKFQTFHVTLWWNALHYGGLYHRAREWLVGDDGFFTTFYHSSGDPPKTKLSCCHRCCRHCCNSATNPHNRNGYWYNGVYYGDPCNTNSNIGGDGSSGGGSCCFGDSNANSGSVPLPSDGIGPQVVVSTGSGDSSCNMDCSGVDCSGVDCKGCEQCVSGCIGGVCQPEVICCCLFLFAS
ncbi:hypothetical protein U1Q18_051656, partial [Sarracenia purpurea var. burkii]